MNSLVGKWNMLAVTYVGGTSGSRNVYWNGAVGTLATGSVNSASKTSQFNIGESLVFTGRFFQGGIDDVAVWNRALSGTEIAAMYKAAR